MYPQSHFLFSLLIALIFVKFGVFDYKIALFIAIFAVLMDLDHYITFIFKYKEMDFKDAWNKAVKGLYAGRSFIHHTVGFVLITAIIVLLYFFNQTWFWIIGLGYYTHMFLDYAHLNVLKIKEKITIKEFGITEKINKFEVLLDIFLVIGIGLLLI
ncbi:metal-dependent hydrolase [Candidatus Pacearchaeota archaeon]|nr:metal-dependent hydrolase [Candidatus Pacearchaeota archaeon]